MLKDTKNYFNTFQEENVASDSVLATLEDEDEQFSWITLHQNKNTRLILNQLPSHLIV